MLPMRRFLEANYGGEIWEGAGWHPCEVRGRYEISVGKLLGEGGILSLVKPPLKWVMAKGLSFGRIDGVRRSSCVIPFPLYMCWLCQRRLRWRNCGKTKEGEGIPRFTRHFNEWELEVV